MAEQHNGKSPQADPIPSEDYRRARRGTFLVALVAAALLAGITDNLLSKAFGQGISWLDRIRQAVVGALASRLTATVCDEESWANASS